MKNNIFDVAAIGFDWDGTLVDSMGVKSQSFAEATINLYPELKERRSEIEEIYLNSRGNPRTFQLELVQKKYGLPKPSEQDEQAWSDNFTALYLGKNLPLFPDTIETLERLKRKGYKLFLCSSVPQHDLDETLKLYPVEKYFKLILGTRGKGKFRKGIPHLTFVSKALKINLSRIAFVGDAPDDVKGANEAGCVSIAKLDLRIEKSIEELIRSNPVLAVTDLRKLLIFF